MTRPKIKYRPGYRPPEVGNGKPNPMTREAYRAALTEMNLSQDNAAYLFTGKTGRTGRRWAKDGAPFYVALIIALMRKYHLSPADIRRLGRPWRKLAALGPEELELECLIAQERKAADDD
jgi:hypothetical protein